MRKEKLKKSLSEVKWTELISLLGYQNIQKTCFLLFLFERIFRLICVTEIHMRNTIEEDVLCDKWCGTDLNDLLPKDEIKRLRIVNSDFAINSTYFS